MAKKPPPAPLALPGFDAPSEPDVAELYRAAKGEGLGPHFDVAVHAWEMRRELEASLFGKLIDHAVEHGTRTLGQTLLMVPSTPGVGRARFDTRELRLLERAVRTYTERVRAAPRAEAPRIPPPPATSFEALRSWAHEYGVVSELLMPMSDAMRSPLVHVPAVLLSARRGLAKVAVDDLLLAADVSHRGPLSELPRALFATAQTFARTFLTRHAEERWKSRIAREARRAARPVAPTPALRALAEEVAALQQRLADALPDDTRDALSWQEDPVDVSVDSEARVTCVVPDPLYSARDRGLVAVTLDLGDRGERGLHTSCARCGDGRQSCTHRVRAMDALLDTLHAPDASTLLALRRVLDTPPWERVLSRFDTELSRLPPRDPSRQESQEYHLEWRLALDHPDGPVLPWLRRRNPKGGLTAGSELDPLVLLHSRHADRFPAAERVLARSFERAGQVEDDAVSVNAHRAFRMLEALEGHDDVVLAADPTVHITVRRVPVDVLAVREEDGSLAVTPVLDGRAETAASTLAALQQSRWLVHLDREAGECLLGEADDWLCALARAVRRGALLVPPAAEEAVLRRLSLLEPRTRVLLPPDLAAASVPPDRRLWLRLLPREPTGLDGTLTSRPLGGTTQFTPGVGPTELFGFVDGRRVKTTRDHADERARMQAVIAALELESTRNPDRPNTFTFADPDLALRVVELLGAGVAPDVVAEWPRGAWSVTRAATGGDLRVAVSDRHDFFGVEGEIEVDGEKLALAALLDAIRRGHSFAALGPGRWMAIGKALRERLAAAAEVLFPSKKGLEASVAAAPALSDLLETARERASSTRWKKLSRALDAHDATPPEVPKELRAELRAYQEEGFRWLMRLSRWVVGGVLADDMGLGKTLQALAVLQARSADGPALVVAPTSVCFNWVRESERFAPGLRPRLHRENAREEVLKALGPGDLLITSYGLCTRHADALKAVRFTTLVLDEAQYCKNANTRRARAVRELQADWRFALTGTPLENHLGELWSLFRVVTPGLLGSWEQFRERFAAPIERSGEPARRAALARVVKPFLLRRTKAAVAPELPARTDIRRTLPLSPGERRVYEDARLAILAQLGGEAVALQPNEQRFQVLAALTRLRQLACHPRLCDPTYEGSSSKLATLLELIDELRDEGHRALVFSQFTSHLALVQDALRARNIPYLYLDGQTPPKQRERLVDSFQSGDTSLFLISLKAGGTGLNLTGADYVIHLDPWWNPAVEDQATDRAHRIGQTRPVTVYRLVAEGTIEEQILALHDDKRDLVAGVLEGSADAGRMSTEDLLALIRAGTSALPAAVDDSDDEG